MTPRIIVGGSSSGRDRLHQAMAARVAKGELPGLVTLIARGEEVDVDAIGATAVDGREPMRRDTVFRIASMTKPILAAATMMLVEGGQLALAEPVDRVLPELANRRVLRRIDGPLDDTVAARRPITVEDLLTFRMGYGLIFEPSFAPPYPIVKAAAELQLVMGGPGPPTPHDPDEWIKRFWTLPLMHQPGERWQYNAGALVLSVLAARAADQPLGAFFSSRIFEPLGMRATGFSAAGEKAGPPPVFPSGAAGLFSTADDFLAFARMLLNQGVHDRRRLISEASVELMTTNHLTPEQIAGGGPVLGGRGWGFGMAVATAPTPLWAVPGRYGWEGGSGTAWFNDPHQSLVALALSQTPDFLFNGGAAEFARLAPEA